jgi:hypothetical protein
MHEEWDDADDDLNDLDGDDPFAPYAGLEGDFIESIYNYCDRWCEECAFTARCFLYAQEQRMMERHVLRGEDPDDPKVAMQDVKDSLKQAMRMLAKVAREQGIDLNALPPARGDRKHRSEHPLNQRARRWLDRVGALLKRLRQDLASVSESPEAQQFAGWLPPDARDAEQLIEALTNLRDGADLLSRYRFLIPVKIARALSGIGEAGDEDDVPDTYGYRRLDSLRTVRLVIACLERAEAALWTVSEIHDDWRDPALSLVVETQALRQAVGDHFAGWQEVRRPGFDEG